MISFDTNLLLYSLNRDCAEYADARAFFASLPTAPAAVAVIQTLRQHPTWSLIDYPGDTASVMEEVWLRAAQPNVGRRVIFDARLALTLRHHGVTEFATRNDSHFAGFGFAHVWNPLAKSRSA